MLYVDHANGVLMAGKGMSKMQKVQTQQAAQQQVVSVMLFVILLYVTGMPAVVHGMGAGGLRGVV
jgi:hypothetical protein